MSAHENLIDFDIIEGQKENIQSLPGGRSARMLANLYSQSPLQPLATPSPSDTQRLNDVLRREYETELVNISESDDPLDIFDRYVKWTLSAYPSATAKEAQLLPLLERATKTFLNNTQYKDDPRYLKLWLSYIRFFSDAPRETFAFLARHSVGESLALYYEEFASWLEGAGRWGQAEEVYKLGIDKEARPALRLARKYNEFQQRHAQQSKGNDGPPSPALPTVRPALAAKIDPFAPSPSPMDPQTPRPGSGLGSTSTTKSGKPKMAIFSDVEDPKSATSAGNGVKGWESIGSLADRRKENIIEPKPWVGETLKVEGKKSNALKMAVFKDEVSKILLFLALPHIDDHRTNRWRAWHICFQSLAQPSNPQTIVPQKDQVTINLRSGRSERIFVNLEAVYPRPDQPGTEMSFEELRASVRGWLHKTWASEQLTVLPNSQSKPVSRLRVFTEPDSAVAEGASSNSITTKLEPHGVSTPEDMGDSHLKQQANDKLVISQEPAILDENGAIKTAGREGRGRKLKTVEVNETQISKY